MLTFIKTQAASILGSGADYLTTIILVEIFHWGYLPANAAGNICGGTAQFILCRNWVFKLGKKRTRVRALKFILVFIGNLLLSSAGIYFFTHYIRTNYIISKTITSVLLGISYNYWMQKKFVFS
ncbi:MAG TPA: GtrA family protein [Chitinophagaceae bacterium]|jgi:putative flippase GtrA|nr:GtrA family protein [Chitinophagaceae bacterium]